MSELRLDHVSVSIGQTQIVDDLSLVVPKGELHVLMGPNGSGKSTLLNALMGNPTTTVTSGTISINGEDVTAMPAEQRARRGLFLAFQYPPDVPGVTLGNFTRLAKNELLQAADPQAKPVAPAEFVKTMNEASGTVGLAQSFIGRSVNEGFSGGEKKRSELLQMMILKPQFALLDELDSGVDVDALNIIAESLNTLLKTGECGMLLVTHQGALLDRLNPDGVHIMSAGRIIRSGGKELADEILAKGYENIVS